MKSKALKKSRKSKGSIWSRITTYLMLFIYPAFVVALIVINII